MKNRQWLQTCAEPKPPEADAGADGAGQPETVQRLSELAPGGRQPQNEQQRQEALRQGYARLKAQFDEVRAIYPQASLQEQLDNPAFMRLVVRGIDARSAYELTHLRELQSAAVAYGANRAREELTAAMQAGYLRPQEGGLNRTAGGTFEESPEQWSRKTREELKTRARRGEKIRL